MRTSILVILLAVIACSAVPARAGTIEVSPPVQLTDDSYYERGQSVTYNGSDYWLFYGRSASVTGSYQNSDPDVNDYGVYYKTASSIAGLSSATAQGLPGATNSYRGATGAAYFGDEVWAFATIVSDTTADLNGWYYDGLAWNQVSSIVTGLSADSAHHDEIEFNGELFVVVRRANFYTTHCSTPKTGGWSSEVQVNTGADAGGGQCRFFKHGADLYLAVFRSDDPPTNMVFQYESVADSWTKVAEVSSSGGAPTLFRAANTYVFAQSPWVSSSDGGHRHVIAWSNSTLAGVFDGSSTMVSEAMYGTNTWTDMWPTELADEDGSHLFYTSERADPAQEGTGNIWCVAVDWDFDHDHYAYIQNAADAAGAGDTVSVAAGIYHNDLHSLSQHLTLLGANADVDPAGSTDRGTETTLTRDDATVFSIQSGAGGAVINGLRFGSSSAQSGRQIEINDATDVSIVYSIFLNSSGHGVSIGANADRAQILYNTVDNSASDGIVNPAAADVVISGNTLRNVAGRAITTSGKALVSGNTILDCTDGIRAEYTGTGLDDRVEIAGNAISYTDYRGISLTGSYTYVHDNVLSHCNYYGSDGLGDWDYASIHLEPGATNCAIAGNRVHDGINGIQTWANDVVITDNFVEDMGASHGEERTVGGRIYKNSAILVGSNWGSGDYDPTGVLIQNNAVQDNYWGLFYSADLTNGVAAEDNWWGDASGPYDPNGVSEVDQPADCNVDPADDKNSDGLGDQLSGGVDYCPWLNAYARLTLEADADCYAVDDTVTVEIWMRDIVETIVAGQFYLHYNDTVLTLVSVDPGDVGAVDPNNPFEVEVYECSIVEGGSNPQCDPVAGLIDYAVGIPGGATGVAGDAKMAVITFTASAQICSEQELIIWRSHIPPSRLGDDNSQPVYPLLVDLDVVDDEAPLATAPSDVTVECEADVPAGVTTYTEFIAAGGTASDNCTAGDDLLIEFADGPLTGGPCGGTITRTYTITDQCGNYCDLAQTITVDDTTDPVATPPADVTVDCETDVPAAATNYAEFVGQGGTASDNCTAGDDLLIGFVDGPLTGGPCGGTITRTYTITDQCGNYCDVAQTITVNDTTDPVATPPTDVTVECETDVPAAATNYAEFVGQGGTASDNCTAVDDLLIGFVDGPLTGGPCGGTITRGYTITDGCGNHCDVQQTITVNDTTDPLATPPTDETVECLADIPAAATTYAEFVAQGGTASDNCTAGDDLVITHSDSPLSGPCPATITRTYTITDGCGNDFDVQQTFTVEDTTDPVATPPSDVTVECETDVPAGATTYAEFVAQGGTASDNCTAGDDLLIESVDGPLTGGPCGGTITRTYTITDECSNDYVVQQTITVDDTIAPTFTRPDDITMNADAGGCTLTLSLAEIGEPSALNDNCTPVGELVVSWVRSDSATNLDDPFTGTTTITWRVEDACGNFETDPLLTVQTITVWEFNELVVNVALKDVSEPTLSRCITFELWNCTTSTSQTVSEVIAFTGGVASNVSIDVPCGAWDCIRARDALHTLWRTDVDDFGIFGRQYLADLTDQSGSGGDDDALIGGNLFDDVPPYAPPQFIDIMDYAVFVNNWAVDYGTGNTDCNDVPPHADISGDGTVGTGDFTFIQTYFAVVDDPGCCGLFGSGNGPRIEISVAELIALGLDELLPADLNCDGWVDEEDVIAFANGVRPGPRPADVGPAVRDRAGQTAQPGAPGPAPPRQP